MSFRYRKSHIYKVNINKCYRIASGLVQTMSATTTTLTQSRESHIYTHTARRKDTRVSPDGLLMAVRG